MKSLVKRLLPSAAFESVKTFIRAIARGVRPVAIALAEADAGNARRWATAAHKRLRYAQWNMGAQPEFYDHYNDLHYDFPVMGKTLVWERGVFGSLALHGGNVLELACGDGFLAKHFYGPKSRNVVACDFDPAALATANRKNKARNVEFVLADIRDAMPAGAYENVVWDAAIEHFTPEEIDAILTNIKTRLLPGGTLGGYTIVATGDGNKLLSHHEHEFESAQELEATLSRYFINVKVFETPAPDRRNLYFWASDGALPSL